jgi:2-hydroxychromene-2-carboxylate isomerase
MVPGSPGYVLHGEPFFGQDRIDDLEHALDTGRAPFRAD